MNDNWTFGLPVSPVTDPSFVKEICQSILNLQIPRDKFEIRMVGGEDPKLDSEYNIVHKAFDENEKKAWITRKKNIIFCEAKFENISIGHDYVKYHPDWYKGFLEFDTSWDVSMCKIANKDGVRYRDFVTWNSKLGQHPDNNTIHYVDYNDQTKIRKMYISGSYYCGKTKFLREYQLDDRLIWGQSEDVKWSLEVRDFWNYKMNSNSIVQFLKQKDPHPITDQRII